MRRASQPDLHFCHSGKGSSESRAISGACVEGRSKVQFRKPSTTETMKKTSRDPRPNIICGTSKKAKKTGRLCRCMGGVSSAR